MNFGQDPLSEEKMREAIHNLRAIAMCAQAVRALQREYFRTRNKVSLQLSIEAEKRLDSLLHDFS